MKKLIITVINNNLAPTLLCLWTVIIDGRAWGGRTAKISLLGICTKTVATRAEIVKNYISAANYRSSDGKNARLYIDQERIFALPPRALALTTTLNTNSISELLFREKRFLPKSRDAALLAWMCSLIACHHFRPAQIQILGSICLIARHQPAPSTQVAAPVASNWAQLKAHQKPFGVVKKRLCTLCSHPTLCVCRRRWNN